MNSVVWLVLLVVVVASLGRGFWVYWRIRSKPIGNVGLPDAILLPDRSKERHT